MPPKKTVYTKLTQIQHCLKRPNMYIGSVTNESHNEYIFDQDKIISKTITTSEGISRIFLEVLSNAIDNVTRSQNTDTPCTAIKITIDADTGLTTVWNDGEVIPVELHEEEKIYNHTLVFSHLLSGSNYDDTDEQADISGTNGLGIKLCSIFSKSLSVRGFDPNNGKLFKQTWTNNLSHTDGPIVTSSKLKNGFTEVSYIPDFERFNLKAYTSDILSLYHRYAIDCAMLTKCKVSFNNEIIPVKNLLDYAYLYSTENNNQNNKKKEDDEEEDDKEDKHQDDVLYIKYKNSEVVLMPSENTTYTCISFANRIYTSQGGVHVKAWLNTLLTPILQKFNKDGINVTIEHIKSYFKIFVVASVVKPKYESQSKHMLKSPTIDTEIKKKDITNMLKWQVMDEIKDFFDEKNNAIKKKAEGKKGGFLNIKDLDLASKAKGKNSYMCMLAICEGKSAKTFIAKGLQHNGIGTTSCEYISVFSIRGKPLNTQDKKATTIANNAVISNLIKIIGLRYKVDYTKEEEYQTLRHGRLVIVADQDTDGTHIMGLIINMIGSLFPTLLQRKEPFIYSLQTPLVRCFIKGKPDLLFYDEREFKSFLERNPDLKFSQKHKYYKGLGTHRDEDIIQVCGRKVLSLTNDDDTPNTLVRIFGKKNTNIRKEWMQNHIPSNLINWKNDDSVEQLDLSIPNFINTIMIHFCFDACTRAIPNLMDGLKESQRKILYSCFKKNLNWDGESLKVAQLSGYCAENSNYHHGEASLQGTIVNMAQFFVGTNNIPLLYEDGQFGSALQGGKDSASPRYIYTRLEEFTRYIFIKEDDCLLERNYDGDDAIEPIMYYPIIPMVLVNGAEGMGTGYSTSIPLYNPMDVIQRVKDWINDKELVDLIPWYQGFKGSITRVNENKFITSGVIEEIEEGTIRITELPIGLYIAPFTENLKKLEEDKIIKSKDAPLNTVVDIKVTEFKDGMRCNLKNLKLTSTITTTNMMLFDENNKLHKYNSTSEIIDNFCKVRIKLYTKRKEHLLKLYNRDITVFKNIHNFIIDVLGKKIPLFEKKKESELIDILEELKYDKIEDSFKYLTNMSINNFTKEKIEKIEKDVQIRESKIEHLKQQTEKMMWLQELDDLETIYPKRMKKKIEEKAAGNPDKKPKTKKGKKDK